MPNKPLEIQWDRFSSWRNLDHTICYILRWKSLNQLKGPISLDANFVGQKAEQRIFKLVQKEAFPTEYAALTEKKRSCLRNQALLHFAHLLTTRALCELVGVYPKRSLIPIQNIQFFCHQNTLQCS